MFSLEMGERYEKCRKEKASYLLSVDVVVFGPWSLGILLSEKFLRKKKKKTKKQKNLIT